LPPLKHVQLALFEGLDEAQYQKYSSSLQEFTGITGNGFPLRVLERRKASRGKLKSGVDSMIGLNRNAKRKACFQSFEEMLATAEQLADHEFPVRGGSALADKP